MKEEFKDRVQKHFKNPIIKKSHRGLFTKKANAHGEGVQEYAHEVVAEHKGGNLQKQAQFAINFGGKGK